MTKVRENLESRIKNILEEIRELDAEISKIKAEIEEEKQKLVVHYHNLLREGKDTRSEGLVWIIKAIWRLKKTILPTFLPNFLDDELIRFILSYTKDVIKLEQLKKEIDETPRRNEKIKERASNKVFMSTKNSGEEGQLFKTRLNEIVRENFSPIKDSRLVAA